MCFDCHFYVHFLEEDLEKSPNKKRRSEDVENNEEKEDSSGDVSEEYEEYCRRSMDLQSSSALDNDLLLSSSI